MGLPYFDQALNGWIVSRYDDVRQALHFGATHEAGKQDPSILLTTRDEVSEALSTAQIREWLKVLEPRLERCLDGLPADEPVDIVSHYLVPSCLDLAVLVTGVPEQSAAAIRKLAEPVSIAAADPGDEVMRLRAEEVTPTLDACFHARVEALRAPGFLGLAYTLPALLANGCYALCVSAAQWQLFHRQPEIAEIGVGELMRYAGLTRTLKRRAKNDLSLGGVMIPAGDLMILQIEEANHDSASFPNPEELILNRLGARHLTLGAGAHACVAAGLLRLASAMILKRLTSSFSSARLMTPVEWRGGAGFRSPEKLLVLLRRSSRNSCIESGERSAESEAQAG